MNGPGGWVVAALMLAGPQVGAPPVVGGSSSENVLRTDKPHPPVPIGAVGQWFGADAYPPDAIAANEQGRVTARVTVGIDGRPTACTVVTSSGSFALDSGTCAIVMANITFEPAVGADGRPVIGYYPLAVRWVMPRPVAPPLNGKDGTGT